MKALKEKRISLRSLWRRGLVILSLFALVFASCGDSSEDNTPATTTNDPRIDHIEVTWGTPLSRPVQYLGARVDLTGVEAKVYYKGQTEPVTVTDKTRFTTIPKVVTGWYDEQSPPRAGVGLDFQGMPGVRLFFDGGEYFPSLAEQATTGVGGLWTFVDANGDLNVKDIKRDVIGWGLDNMVTFPSRDSIVDDGIYSSGLYAGPPSGLRTKRVFVDDDTFDFSGMTLEAVYTDGATQKLSFEDAYWMVLPEYDDTKKNDDGTYKGWVYIMVGADLEDGFRPVLSANFDPAANDWYTWGITARIPLEAVYTVETIEYKLGKDLEDYFFWMENTPAAWTQRLIDADCQLTVKYTGNQTKTKSIEELQGQSKIWWNRNPGALVEDLFVMPLSYPFTVKANKDPAVKIYYRGAGGDAVWGRASTPASIPILVYTKLASFTVTNAAGKDISFPTEAEANESQDNDLKDPGVGGTEAELAELFTAVAEYQAYNDATKSKPVTATLIPTWTPSSGTFPAGSASGPYFVTNYDQVRQSIKKNETTKAVKIWHTVNTAAVEAMLVAEYQQQGTYNDTDKDFPNFLGVGYNIGLAAQQSMNKTINVTWTIGN